MGKSVVIGSSRLRLSVDTSSSSSDAGPPTAATDDVRPQSVEAVPAQHDLDVPPRPLRWHFGPGGIWTRMSLVDEDVMNALQQAVFVDVPARSSVEVASRH
uniref:WWE domain-containing protein n=1 Tax=Panagrellus redivivus TaxID=6233 RepID=A0A7E4UV40_PANRE